MTTDLVMPQHIAIIMDGNGRWANRRRMPVALGHRAGAEALRKLVPEAAKRLLPHLTVYAFSTENWKRPAKEVDDLMDLLRRNLQRYIDEAHRNDVRISVIGKPDRLAPDLQKTIAGLIEATKNKRGMHLHIALDYGSRDEIVRAARRLARRAREEALAPDDIDEALFESHLDTAGIPAPDLLIRTGGESRLSNFLLWQMAYTDLYITEKYWPDFTHKDLLAAVEWHNTVEKRHGGR